MENRTAGSAPALPRRQALRILAVAGAGVLALRFAGGGRGARVVRRRALLMGTEVHLAVAGPDRDVAEAAAVATLARMGALEGELSRYRPESAVGRLNATGTVAAAPRSLLEVLALARRISEASGGAFDVTMQPLLDVFRARSAGTLPPAAAVEEARARVDWRALDVDGATVRLRRPGMAVTLDGIAKGHVVDEGVAVLRAHGFPNVLVDAGGDLMAGGQKSAGTPWRIGIERPRPGTTRLVASFDARDRAVATSGDYRQPFTPDFAQHHILDPRTGWSAPELASATVVAPTAALADGLATAAMVLGPRGATELLGAFEACEGCFVTKELAVVRTGGFA